MGACIQTPLVQKREPVPLGSGSVTDKETEFGRDRQTHRIEAQRERERATTTVQCQ